MLISFSKILFKQIKFVTFAHNVGEMKMSLIETFKQFYGKIISCCRLQRGGSINLLFAGFKILDATKDMLRGYEIHEISNPPNPDELLSKNLHDAYLFINNTPESTLKMAQLKNIVSRARKNVGISIIVVGDETAFTHGQDGQAILHIQVADGESADESVSKSVKKLRETMGRFAGNSAKTRQLRMEVLKIAFSDLNVLILGETGTGKTLLARIIHDVGPRKNENFVGLNSATIPISLIESELFGHVRGAYTSADSTKSGMIDRADKGHMFFDEIAELPVNIQAKLLQVVEDGTYNILGDSTPKKVDVKFISATNRDPSFLRKDLFFRFSESVLEIPPLRQRKDDIPEITNVFFKENGYETKFEDFTEEVQHKLFEYHYPGNVRELQNILKRYMMTGSLEIPSFNGMKVALPQMSKRSPNVKSIIVGFTSSMIEEIRRDGTLPKFPYIKDLLISEFESLYVDHVLKILKWDKHRAADELGISYRYLNKIILKYGLDRRVKKEN